MTAPQPDPDDWRAWPPGTRIILVHTSDPYTELRPGDAGTVSGTGPDAGQLFVNWDSGSTLIMLPDEGDQVRLAGPGDNGITAAGADGPGQARDEARDQVLAGACSPCLEGSHPACPGRTTAFGGPCTCQADSHQTLLAAPAAAAELERIYAGLPARPRTPEPARPRTARPGRARPARPGRH